MEEVFASRIRQAANPAHEAPAAPSAPAPAEPEHAHPAPQPAPQPAPAPADGGWIPDVTEVDVRKQYLVENPEHGAAYAELKAHAPCRLGIGKAGARYKTAPVLQFRAAHSAAQDAVFGGVDPAFLEKMGLFCVQTRCDSKDTYLTRPDLGRRLSEEAVRTLREKCAPNPQVQVFVADGLSSAAVTADIPDLLPAVLQGLEGYGIRAGTPFFVQFGRVGVLYVYLFPPAQRSPACSSASARASSRRNPCPPTSPTARASACRRPAAPSVSNIHRNGTIPAEAGAHIAEILKTVLEAKASGTDLKL